jgi:hypothetical protein
MNYKPRLGTPETAPKNGRMILGDFGWSRLLPCVWSQQDEEWKIARVKRTEDEDKTQSCCFINGTEPHNEMRGWIEVQKEWLFTTRYNEINKY